MQIDNLNEYQKVYLTYKIFDYLNSNNIIKLSKFNITNIENILKVYLTCSKIDYDEEVNNIIKRFNKLNIYEKLDFMIYLFDIVNDIDIVPNYLTNNLNLKDLSNKLIEYKLSI